MGQRDMTRVPDSVERQDFWKNIEMEANSFCEFQPAYVLSLLRSSAYIQAETDALPPEKREATYQRRKGRQQVLADPTRSFEFVMTEGALRWQIGSPDLMIEQITHLTALSRFSHIRLGLIPWTQHSGTFIGHAFHIYNDEIVAVGTAHGVQKTAEPEIVQTYRALFEKLKQIACFGEKARVELARISGQYSALKAVSGASLADSPSADTGNFV
jgi:Domain of unknown function (DUF5753)